MSEELTSSGGKKSPLLFLTHETPVNPLGIMNVGDDVLLYCLPGVGVQVGGCGIVWLAESEEDLEHMMVVSYRSEAKHKHGVIRAKG